MTYFSFNPRQVLCFFFYFYFFAIYKMGDSEYSMGIYKSVKISIGTVIKNPEMLKFILDRLKTKKKCERAVKKLSFSTHCDKSILKNGRTLKFVPHCYKSQQIYPYQLRNTYPSTIEYVLDRFKTQRCMIKPLINFLLCFILFVITIELKKCVIKSSLMIFLS